MLQIEVGSMEEVKKEMVEMKAEHKQKLADIKLTLTEAKLALAELKEHRKACDTKPGKESFDNLIQEQRDTVERLEAYYSNTYNSAPNFNITPVYVQPYNQKAMVLMNWDFLQTALRKLKGMHVSFTTYTNGRYNWLLIHYSKGGITGCMELNELNVEGYARPLHGIPIASEG